ncbi:protein kinase domain-containing protein [Nannocystaceae bacterium ST9]
MGAGDPFEPPRLDELLADDEELETAFMDSPFPQAPEPTQIIDSSFVDPRAAARRSEPVRSESRPDPTVILPAPEAGTIAGRYRLEEKLGSGGMGTVFRAVHMGLNKPVAIKILNNQLAADPAYRERIMREARAVATVSHENIIGVTDVGETDEGIPFVVMEYVDGETLEDTLTREGRLAARRVVRIGLQVCHALVAAHDRGLIHRDIKPANLVLVRSKVDQIKVLDFGLVKILGDISAETKVTHEQAIFGSPLYMSPEQCESRPIDFRTDVYSLGATLYTMLTGHPPFEGSNAVSVMAQHLHVSVRSPREYDPAGIPESLSAVVMRALAKDPGSRFATMREFVAALVAVDSELARPGRAASMPHAMPMQPQVPVQAMPAPMPMPHAMPTGSHTPLASGPHPHLGAPTGPHAQLGTGPQPAIRKRGFEWTTSTVIIAWLVALIVGVVLLIVIKLAIM